MYEFIKVFILGIVEGITEFLPISSTGHLILVQQFISLEPERFANAFSVIIQLGAILSVVVLYFKKLNPFDRDLSPAQRQNTFILWSKVIIAVLPATVLGLLFDDLIDKYLFKPLPVAVTLIVWGLVIILIEKRSPSSFKFNSIYEISYKTAFLIGLFQCLAMIPGTSRSAATIIGAMLLGTSRTTAAEFSFFLAIPTMLGATLLKVIKVGLAFSGFQWALILFGSVVSFVVALLVIKKLMLYIQKHNFSLFGYYRIVLGTVVLLSSLLFKLKL
ncbi:undecaprenyl-diphosphate phosphatase [Filifactor villosus]|uniref:Undecaprenyl-diphosphatase n=1 Tax=Filifactor villosus TaxID=29374 RepID=A0ABV9QJA2_9FIRM